MIATFANWRPAFAPPKATVLVSAAGNGRKKQEAPGFPIFPHSRRILEVPLDAKAAADTIPTEVSFQFDNFKVEEKLQAKTNNNLQLASGATPVKESAGEKP